MVFRRLIQKIYRREIGISTTSVTSRCVLLLVLVQAFHGHHWAATGEDTIKTGSLITNKEAERNTLVSVGEKFELGFFNPDREDRNYGRYVGIWYRGLRPRTTVWVANRDNPLPELTVGHFGLKGSVGLVLLDEEENPYFLTSFQSLRPSNMTARITDSGNLVVSDFGGKEIWRSFDHPTDTFLPGMKMDDGLFLTSWKSRHDPGSGNFTFRQDEDDVDHYIVFEISDLYWKSRESSKFRTYDEMSRDVKLLLKNSSDSNYTRLVMSDSRKLELWRWDVKNGWHVTWAEPRDECGVYNYCGNFGSCTSNNGHEMMCKCLPGFSPTSPERWNSGQYTDGKWRHFHFSE